MSFAASILDFCKPNNAGYVALTAVASLPAVFPNFSVDCVTSRMSSMTWKASPSDCPKSLSALSLDAVTLALIPPRRSAHVSNAAVLDSWINWSVALETAFPSLSKSSTCPAIKERLPDAVASSRMKSAVVYFWVGSVCARISNASVSNASPASTASPSPNTIWQVGLPRRRSSSSMQGRSS